jgi:hypothetical protein
MGPRRATRMLLATVMLATACGEQSPDRESVTGPDFKPTPPPPPTVCDFSGLSTLIRGYFPGSLATPIVNIKDLMAAQGAGTEGARDYGFVIMDSVGSLSRQDAVTTDPDAGARLTIGLIYCMFNDAASFTYPTTALADFTAALTEANGGSYYVRGGGDSTDPEGRTGPVLGIDFAQPVNLSGVEPVAPFSWSTVLAGNGASEGRALIYGYLVTASPLEYEWSTVPSNTLFNPGAVVAVCDGSEATTTDMIQESGIGVLAYAPTALCSAGQSLTLIDTGWGPRALASRLARVVVDAVSPAPLQAATVTTVGKLVGGTATTFKSKFKTKGVTSVTLAFAPKPTSPIKLDDFTNPVTVRAATTAALNNPSVGVNGVCIYLTGSNNNGANTALTGTGDGEGCAAPVAGGVVSKTKSKIVNGVLTAGYADFTFGVNKTGGLVLTASSTDGQTTGVLGRDGQTFINATAKLNVKP